MKKGTWIVVGLALAVVLALLGFFINLPGQLKSQLSVMGLPKELYDKQQQLEKLYIQGPVRDFRWLKKNGLKELTIDSPEYKRLGTLPHSLDSLTLKQTQLERLSNMERLSLTQLVLEGNQKLNDLSPLAQQNSLQDLNISGSPELTELPWRDLTGLLALRIHETSIFDVSGLAELENLRVLELEGRGELEQIPNLHKLTRLRVLKLTNTRLKDLDFLEGLLNLQDIYLESNHVLNDVDALASLPKLAHLTLVTNRKLSWGHIPELPTLQSFELRFSVGMQDVSGIQKFPNLTKLSLLDDDLVENYQNALEGIAQLKRLDTLELVRNDALKDLGFLQELPNLCELRIIGSHNLEQEAFSLLAGLMQLEALELKDCRHLEDLGFLDRMNLKALYLEANPNIFHIGELPTLINLEQLSLDRNDLFFVPVLSSFPSLKELFLNRPNADRIFPEMNGDPREMGMRFKSNTAGPLFARDHLRELDLSYNSQLSISDLEGIDSCKNIRVLKIQDTSLKEGGPISGLTQLRVLDLRDTPVKKLSFLPESVTELYLSTHF